VHEADGKHIGEVDHLIIDKLSGRVAYAVVSFGGSGASSIIERSESGLKRRFNNVPSLIFRSWKRFDVLSDLRRQFGCHSITSSACASSVAGISRLSALAVLRLTTNKKFEA
jgi:hypothetical protein